MKTIVQKINDLAKYLYIDHHRDLIFEVIYQLRKSLEEACDGEYTKQDLLDLVFSKNDCLALEGADDLPKEMLEEVDNLHQEIVDAYGLQD